MARIAVLDHNQRESDTPRRHLKRAVGKVLVARCLAYWVTDAIIRMIPIEEIRARYLAAQTLSTPWEPIEIPGLHFEEPNIRHNPAGAIVRRQKPRMEWEAEPILV